MESGGYERVIRSRLLKPFQHMPLSLQSDLSLMPERLEWERHIDGRMQDGNIVIRERTQAVNAQTSCEKCFCDHEGKAQGRWLVQEVCAYTIGMGEAQKRWGAGRPLPLSTG